MQAFRIFTAPEIVGLTFPQNPSEFDESYNDIYKDTQTIDGGLLRTPKTFDNRERTLTWEKINYVKNAAFIEALEGYVIDTYGKTAYLYVPDGYKTTGNLYEVAFFDFNLEYHPEIRHVAKVTIKYIIRNASLYNY